MGHRPSTLRTVGEMLYDEFEACHVTTGILESVFASADGSLLVLNFSEGGGLNLKADVNLDTIALRDGPREFSGLDVSRADTWRDFIGVPLFCGWLTINQKGYADGALLSFRDVKPDVCITVVASSLKVARVGAWTEATAQ